MIALRDIYEGPKRDDVVGRRSTPPASRTTSIATAWS